MDKVKRFFYDSFRCSAWMFTSFDNILEPKTFISELPAHLHSKLHELEDEYFWCRYCHKVFPGPDVEIVENERFACHDCMQKLRRCHI